MEYVPPTFTSGAAFWLAGFLSLTLLLLLQLLATAKYCCLGHDRDRFYYYY